MFSIGSSKSLGSDAHGNEFYKSTSDIIGHDLVPASNVPPPLRFLTTKLLAQINATSLAMAPKVVNPTTLANIRAIACCNILFTCITKVLCDRILLVLP